MNNKQYDHRLGSGLIGRILMWLWLILTTVLNGQTGSVLVDPHLKLEIQSTNKQQDFNVRWPSDVGTIYQVQSPARIYENTWTNVGMPITAAENLTTFPIRTPLLPQQYYRVAKTAAILFKDDFETDNAINAQDVVASTGYSGLILRTTDGGESWTTVFNPMLPLRYFENLHSVVQFARFSGNADIIYAAGRSAEATATLNRFTKSLGVLKSTDDGAHWEFVTNGLIADLNINTVAIHPSNLNIVYAGTLNGGIYQTSDAGAHWQPIGGNFAVDVRSIAIDSANPKVIYAGTEGSGLYRSTDGGLTWKHGSIGLDPNATVRSIVIDPTNTFIVWAADNRSGVYRSTDGGNTWAITNDGLNMRAVNVLTISADGQVLYVATSGGGVYRLGLITP